MNAYLVTYETMCGDARSVLVHADDVIAAADAVCRETRVGNILSIRRRKSEEWAPHLSPEQHRELVAAAVPF